MPLIRPALQPTEKARPKAERQNPAFVGAGGSGWLTSGVGGIDNIALYNSWSWVAIDAISEAMAALEWYVTQPGKDGTHVDAPPDAWVTQLLDDPNADIEPANLWSLAARWFLINGNAYIYAPTYGEKTPQELWVLPSNRIQIVLGGRGEPQIKGYTYYHDSGTYTIDASEVIHWKMLDPSRDLSTSQYLGRSPLNAGMDAVIVDRENQHFQRRYLESDATPAFVILDPHMMDDQTFQVFKGRWNETFMGASRAGRWGLLDEGKQIQTLASNGRLRDSYELDDHNRDRICTLWRTPEPYLTAKHQNRATAEVVTAEFHRMAVTPRARRLAQVFTRMARRFDPQAGYKVDFQRYQIDDPDQTRADRESLFNMGVVTRDEIRMELGYDPLPPAKAANELRTTVGGATAVQQAQVFYTMGQLSREAAIANAVLVFGFTQSEAEALFPPLAEPPAPTPSEPPPDDPEQDGDDAESDEGEDDAGEPVEPVDGDDDPEGEGEADDAADATTEPETRTVVRAEGDWTEKQIAAYWKKFDAIADAGRKQLTRSIGGVFDRMADAFLAEQAPTKGQPWSVTKDWDDFFERWRNILGEETEGDLRRLIDRAGGEALKDVDATPDDLSDTFKERVTRSIDESSGKITTAVDTVKADLQKYLRENRGLSVDELREGIKRKFQQYSDSGAQRIARTTSTFATNRAQREAWRAAERDIDGIVRIVRLWTSQRDTQVRVAHTAADGQAEDNNGMFTVGGETVSHPGEGSRKNAVNCRCYTRPRIKRSE